LLQSKNDLAMLYLKPPIDQRAGFTLIEVLISILVLSIGIIGAVKMQMNSIQATQQSNYFSAAVELATEIADKMRSNGDQMRSTSSPFLKVNFQADKDHIEPTTTCFNVNCAPDQLAQSDITEWLQNIRTSLPNARAVICHDDAPWDSSNHSLTWACSATGNNSSVVIKLGWAEKNEAIQTAQTTGLISPPRLAIAVIPYIN
jgi:type IV pilus assembly protein PilV